MADRSEASEITSRIDLSTYKQRINASLEEFMAPAPALLELELSRVSTDALDKLREYSLRPGKRIRGSLAAAAYDFVSGSRKGQAGLQLGVALELIQSYLLIADDVMDKSDLRRGLPTVHRLYADEGDAYSDEHEASMLAINVGLIAQHLANLALLQAEEEPGRILLAMDRLHRNVTATGFGQIDDVYQQVGRTISDEDLVRKYMLKSSYYTFINPLQCGIALAGVADEAQFEEVKLFGEAAGVAFQLHDDYLGIFGEASATGKLNVDDLREGKYTLLVHYALAHAAPDDARQLRGMLGNEALGEADVARARAIFSRCGAKAFAESEAQRFAMIAKERLAVSTVWDESLRTFLSELVDFSVSRRA